MTTYRTHIQQRRLGDKLYVLETIRDLDEAIDQLCAELGDDGAKDPFAEDLCPYFGILWPAAEGLAQYLQDHSDLVKGRTVLELGAGLAFPSMVAAHLGARRMLVTDYHPDVESYLHRNLRHSDQVGELEYQRFNWRGPESELGKFDVVMGSDILYEAKHASEVAQGLARFLAPGGVILLADQGRNYLGKFLAAMELAGFRVSEDTRRAQEKTIRIFEFRAEPSSG